MAPSTIFTLPPDTILLVCELLRTEFNFLPDRSHDLVSFALTSPLLSTLPKDLCTAAPFVYRGIKGTLEPRIWSQLVFLRAPVPRDFERFFTYSRRVRELGVGNDVSARDPLSGEPLCTNFRLGLGSDHQLSFAAWDFLSAFGPKPLLPNLHSIYLAEQVHFANVNWRLTPFHSIDLLCGPRLKVAKFSCTDPRHDPESAAKLVRTLSRVAAALESLSIDSGPGIQTTAEVPEDIGSLYGPEIRLFTHLNTFIARSVRIAPDALIALGSLPSLKVLLLHVNPAEYDWDVLPRGSRGNLFPALEQLTLHKIDFVWCTAFLDILPSTSLLSLSFRCQYDPAPPPTALRALCVAISNLPSALSIINLFFIIGATLEDAMYQFWGYEIYWSEDIAPLSTLPALQRLVFSGQCVVVLEDLALRTMARGWPDLTQLVLTWAWNALARPDDARSPEDDDFPYVTAWGLMQLARYCPRMTNLALAADLRFAHTESDLASARTAPPVCLRGDTSSALVVFDATGSLLGDSVGVASILSLAFPQLSQLWNRCTASTREWCEVKALHPQFVRVRSQERAYAVRQGRRLREPDLGVELRDAERPPADEPARP